MNGKNAAVLGIYTLPGANAVEVAGQVRETMKEISKNFPEGLDYEIPFDITSYISESIHEVYKTVRSAVAGGVGGISFAPELARFSGAPDCCADIVDRNFRGDVGFGLFAQFTYSVGIDFVDRYRGRRCHCSCRSGRELYGKRRFEPLRGYEESYAGIDRGVDRHLSRAGCGIYSG